MAVQFNRNALTEIKSTLGRYMTNVIKYEDMEHYTAWIKCSGKKYLIQEGDYIIQHKQNTFEVVLQHDFETKYKRK